MHVYTHNKVPLARKKRIMSQKEKNRVKMAK